MMTRLRIPLLLLAFVLGNAPLRADDDAEVRALLADLGAADGKVRLKAAQKATAWGVRAAPAADALAELLRDANPALRTAAAAALGAIGPEAVDAGTHLFPLLRDADAGVRVAAIRALQGIAARASAVRPAFLETLRNKGRTDSSDSADALVDLRAEAVRQVTDALRDPAAEVRCAAARALGAFT